MSQLPSQILGYEAVHRRLFPLLENALGGRLILLEGAPSLGKKLMAMQLLREWSSLAPVLLEPESLRSGYTMAQIREISQQIQEMGLTSGRMGYILNEMHLLTPPCCHALLKTLEELPSHVAILGIAVDHPPLLSTLRSRALKVYVRRSSDQELLGWLDSSGVSYTPLCQHLLLHFAQGCPGQAKLFLSPEFQERLAAYQLFSQATSLNKLMPALALIDQLDKDKQLMSSSMLMEELLRIASYHWAIRDRPIEVYKQWLEAIDQAQLLAQRSTKLAHVLELLWLRLQPCLTSS